LEEWWVLPSGRGESSGGYCGLAEGGKVVVNITVGGRGVVGLAVGGKETGLAERGRVVVGIAVGRKEVECLADGVKVIVVPALGEWVWRWVRPKKKV
jgi:hypothetical protein